MAIPSFKQFLVLLLNRDQVPINAFTISITSDDRGWSISYQDHEESFTGQGVTLSDVLEVCGRGWRFP